MSAQNVRYMLDDLNKKFPYPSKRSKTYVNNLNEVLTQFKYISPSLLSTISSHQFYITIRNLIRDLLIDWNKDNYLNPNDTFLLRNCIFILDLLVDTIKNITEVTSWLLESTFINSIADCLSNIDKLVHQHYQKYNFKQLIRLVDLFIIYYQRLPINQQKDERLNKLLEAIIDCLASPTYDHIFRKLKSTSKSLRTYQQFFLITCPAFLILHHGTPTKPMIEGILETLVPRYASILDKHIQSINVWNAPMLDAVHHLLLTIHLVKGYYGPYGGGQPLQWMTDHIVRIIKEETIVNKVTEYPSTFQTLLIDTALRTLTAFVHNPDLLIYIKQLKIIPIIRSLILLSNESIVFHGYIVLAYIMDEDDIKASEKEAGRLLSNIFDSLRKNMRLLSITNQNREPIEHDITLLMEAIQALVQHDQIKSEILKQNALPFLMNNVRYFNERTQRLILESIGSMTFDAEAARLLRQNKEFIKSVKDIEDTNNIGIRKAAEKIIWNLTPGPEKRAEQKQKKETTETDDKKDNKKDDKEKKDEEFRYDIMISYCHDDKELVYRIHRFLVSHGFKIWIDQDQLYGPAMDAMAGAVENSEFIILCMSGSYKRSVYCQAEAEYAFQCKRHLVPLIVRPGYRPDGWLGLLLGSRIYIDFGRYDFQKGCDLLINEISLQRKSQQEQALLDATKEVAVPTEDKPPPTTETPPVVSTKNQKTVPDEYLHRDTSSSTYHSTLLNQWTKKDVLDFLFDARLNLMMPLCESLNGHGLYKFFRMCTKKPTKFYKQLNDELHSRFDIILPIGIFTQFLTEIEEIIMSISTENINQSKSAPPTPLNKSRSPTPQLNSTN